MAQRTNEEKGLLAKLASGQLDGRVGDDLTTSGGSTVWTQIRHGIPSRLKQGPTTKLFDGKETECVPGVLRILKEWATDDDKLAFLQQFGWLMNDEGVRAYSAKFKPAG